MFYCLQKKKKGFPAYMQKKVFAPVLFLGMIFAEITLCPSINLEQPVMVLVFFFFLTYQLSCEMRYLILSVPLSLLSGFKRESRVAFCTAAFLVN